MKAGPPTLSILVCAYNMARELPRTLRTLAADYQRNAEDIAWEIVVLDNGSSEPIDEAALQAIVPRVRVIRPNDIRQSPAVAINRAVATLTGQLIGLWIDGARMASPGIVHHAVEALRADPGRVVGTLGFHLGPDVQMRTVTEGYDAATEDLLLASVPWQEDGYRLFDVAVLAGSSKAGWFGCINETNGLFLDRAVWDRIGGLDERFVAPGGGFVNLDLWERCIAVSGGHPWIILGEGTFHQVHGGAATNGTGADRAAMRAEYGAIHGRPFTAPSYRPHYVGELDPQRFASGGDRPLDRMRKVHSARGRPFRVDLPQAVLASVQRGTLATRYKGRRLAKNPFDLSLYRQVVERLQPRTIIEVGTSEGGSALWLIDQARAFGLGECEVITIDIAPPALEASGIACYRGNSLRPVETFPTARIQAAPHPWLVIEDSAHTLASTAATLAYFEHLLHPGDMLVVEDGVVADLAGDQYRAFRDGPNRAVAEFLLRVGDAYAIEERLCDFYGHNVTYAPNAWLRRV